MKSIRVLLAALLIISLAAAGCSSDKKSPQAPEPAKKTVLKVGATAVPHAEILRAIKPTLEKEGVQIEIIEFSDYVRPNVALADKELDANFFQHVPYLTKFATERKLPLISAAAVHIEPMGVYSKKVKNLNELTQGAAIAIPNDPTNSGRALAVLEKAGLLKLKAGVGVNGTVQDIAENPKGLKIRELDAAQLPRALEDVAAAVINTNYALEAKLVPSKDALAIESKDSPYANILAVRKGDETRPEIQKLVKVLTSEEVKKFINEQYKGAIVPAF
jgi:D-methionine transport system substrate-binding protein